MPSDKKRINLTVPDSIYERLRLYKAKNGIMSDATACLQLIVQQLTAQEQSATIFNVLKNLSPEQISEMSLDGMAFLKDEVDKRGLKPADK